MTNFRTRALLVAAASTLAFATPAIGTVYTLNFNTLPTAQGWTYIGTGTAGTYFTATGASLVQNATPNAGEALFSRSINLGDTQNFRLIVEAKVTAATETISFNSFGFSFGVIQMGHYNYFGIGGSRIRYYVPGSNGYASFPAGYNPAALNKYEIVGVNGLTSFLVNGVQVVAPFSAGSLGSTPTLYLGDGTNNAGASGEITRFSFLTDADAAAAVPEPATWAMMILGFGLVGGTLRRRAVPATT